MPKIPVYDQDGTGLCYAYSASEMMNAYLLKKNPNAGLQIHPALAAIRYSEGESGNVGELSEGSITGAINSCRVKDTYSYKSIEKSLNGIGSQANMSEAQVLNFIESLGMLMSKPKVISEAERNAARNAARIRNKVASLMMTRVASETAVAPTQGQIDSEIRRLAYEQVEAKNNWCSDSQKSALWSFALSAPVGNAIDVASSTVLKPEARVGPPAIPQAQEYDLLGMSEDEVKKFVRDYFGDPKVDLPIGVGFCSEVLYDPSARKITRTTSSSGSVSSTIAKSCGDHAVLLVGTRPNGNSCDYLMRNSWGGDFSFKYKHSCICKNTKTQGYEDCPSTGTYERSVTLDGNTITVTDAIPNRANLKIVSCWIPEDEMAPNLIAATVLSDPKKTSH